MKTGRIAFALVFAATACGGGDGSPAFERIDAHATEIRVETRQHGVAIAGLAALSVMMPEEDAHHSSLRAHLAEMNGAVSDLGFCYEAGAMQAGMERLDVEHETHRGAMAVAMSVDKAHAEETRYQDAMNSMLDELLEVLHGMERYGCHEGGPRQEGGS